jgi:DNA-binding FadR family transcriptional regulator
MVSMRSSRDKGVLMDPHPHGAAGLALANEIERQIRDNSVMPGTVFASEQDLQSRSDAGRSVVRQAVRLLTQRGVAYVRRGAGGGLVVKAPDVELAARNLSIAIERELDSVAGLSSLYTACDAYLFSNVAKRVAPAKADLLRSLAGNLSSMSSKEFEQTEGHRRLVIAFYKAFDDAAGTLFVRAAMECGMDLVPRELSEPESRRRETFWQLTLQSVEALIAGDVAQLFAIRSEQMRFIAPISKWRDSEGTSEATRPVVSSDHPPGLKAERLSREILREIRQQGWVAGGRLGGFEELALRHGASTAVLREATRILEENSSVRMQRGRGGGLIIAEPDRRKAVMRALGYLQATAYPQHSAWEFLDQILMEAIQQGGAHGKSKHFESLDTAIEGLRQQGGASIEAIHRMYIALAGVAASPALQTVAEILMLVALPPREAKISVSPAELANLELLMERVAARDPARARRAYLSYARERPLSART